MAAELNTTTQSSSQTTTQSPQSSIGSGVGGVQTGAVQTGVSSDFLRSQSGIQLNNVAVPTVNLRPGTVASTSTPPATPKHHVNMVLLGFSAVLVLIAIGLFITAGRSVKSTT